MVNCFLLALDFKSLDQNLTYDRQQAHPPLNRQQYCEGGQRRSLQKFLQSVHGSSVTSAPRNTFGKKWLVMSEQKVHVSQ